jgi:hypothetical protein
LRYTPAAAGLLEVETRLRCFLFRESGGGIEGGEESRQLKVARRIGKNGGMEKDNTETQRAQVPEEEEKARARFIVPHLLNERFSLARLRDLSSTSAQVGPHTVKSRVRMIKSPVPRLR